MKKDRGAIADSEGLESSQQQSSGQLRSAEDTHENLGRDPIMGEVVDDQPLLPPDIFTDVLPHMSIEQCMVFSRVSRAHRELTIAAIKKFFFQKLNRLFDEESTNREFLSRGERRERVIDLESSFDSCCF